MSSSDRTGSKETAAITDVKRIAMFSNSVIVVQMRAEELKMNLMSQTLQKQERD
jgi:hypothetical protein